MLKRNHIDAYENPCHDRSQLLLLEILRREVKEKTCFTIQSNADRQVEANCKTCSKTIKREIRRYSLLGRQLGGPKRRKRSCSNTIVIYVIEKLIDYWKRPGKWILLAEPHLAKNWLFRQEVTNELKWKAISRKIFIKSSFLNELTHRNLLGTIWKSFFYSFRNTFSL